jgi:hypothetical protein
MIGQTIKNIAGMASGRSDGMHDLLLVSSFGLWALVLGLAPVLAFRLLLGS